MITVRTDQGPQRDIRGVLFDMDGTLVDSMAVTERTWGAWAAAHGVAARLRILHGRPAGDTVRRCFPDADESTVADLTLTLNRMEHADLEGVVPLPWAHELLTWLDAVAIPWAVVTSADAQLARARLEVAGIEPDVLVTCDDITRGKPDPEPYLLGARLIGIPIATCLVVEDAPAGVESGLASGAVTAALNGLAADVRIADLRHLHRLLADGLTH